MRLTLPTRLLRLMMIILPSIMLIAGCGEGSGKEVIAGTQSPAITGVLLDAPLAGVEWENSGGDLSGITNETGEFQYRQYETVTFRIGGIVLGTAGGAPFVTAVQLTGSTNATDQAAVNQLVFLQSIDVDGDPSNGIFISNATRNRAAGVSLDFKAPDFAARVAVVVAAIGEPGSKVVSETDALQHFFETYTSMGGEAVLGFPFPGFAPSEFKLVFSDEFDVGDSPSTSKWLIETGYGDNGWGNNEWQLYTDSPDNVRVEGGNLVLQARCPTPPCGVRDGTITSARINTLGKFEFKYGKIVARIKPPVGKAAWPAFWALGANFPQIGWPRAGEIDFMEMHNFFSDERTTHSTVHWCDQTIQAPATCSFPDGWIFDTQNRTFPTSLGDDFHIWEAEWDANRITVKIDDTPYFSRTIDAATMEEFQREFFLILNVAMGGTLGSNSQPPDGTEVFPQTMLVDYVRVFQRQGDGPEPDTTIFDFEQAPENYVFTEFEGGPAVVIANPVSGGINTSSQVARMQKFPAGSGATFGGSLLALPTPLDIEAGTSFTMKVWSQRPVNVLFKLEGPGGMPQAEDEVAHGGSGWEELTFNYGTFAATVTNFVFIFDNGTLGAADTDPDNWTFYFDDITLVPPDDGGGGPGGGPGITEFDFEQAPENYVFTEFEGGPAVVINNPVSGGINTSSQVVRMQKFRAGSGATFGGSLLALPTPLDIAAGTSFTMKVWSQRPVMVLFKLEGPGGMPAEEDEVAHGGSGWEELTFNYGSFAATITSFVFIFDNGTLGAADTDPDNWTFYFDDIKLIPPDDGGGGPGGGPAQIDLPITFDDPTVDYTVIDFGEPVAAMTTLAADPEDSANMVASTNKFAGTPVWAGTTMSTSAGFASAIPFTASATTIGIRMYSPDAGIPVRLKAENAADDTVSVETEAMTTVANAWETLIFDFANEVEGASLNLSATYSKLSIFFNFGTDGDTAGDKTYLWDDVEFGVQAPVVDVTPPMLTVARIASDNTNAAFARVGSIITVTIAANEPITAPTVTIGGTAATTVTGSGTTWQARRTLTAADAEGPLTFSIAYSDIAGNAGAIVTTTTNASAVVVDKTIPTVMILGAPATFATLTPISITFQFSEVVSNFSVSGIQVTNGVASGLVSVDGDTYTANITPTGTGALAINVIAGAAGDAAGNVNPFTGSVIVVRDTTPPTLSSVNVASNNANPAFAVTGNTVTVNLTASETILSPVVTIGGMPADTVTGGGTTWQAGRTLTTSDTEGAITFAIAYVDLLGNLGAPVSTTTDASGVVLDVTAPTVMITAPASLVMRDAFSVTFQFSETVTGFTIADITATNGTASGLSAMDGDTYTATITPGGSGDVTIGLASGAALDRAGNPSQMAATVTILGDSMPPSLTAISIASNNANPVLARAGDLVTVTFTADEPITAPTVTIGGIAATSVINSSGNTWQASRTFTAGETGGTLTLSITYSDTSGNAGPVQTMTNDGSSVLLDVLAPTLTITAPAAVSSLAAIPVTFQFSEAVTGFDSISDIVTTNATASVPVLMGGDTYTANITPDGNGDVSIGVAMGAAQDLAGNPNTMATTVTVVVDITPPELTTVSIASSNANPVLARIGDVITVSMTASEPISAPMVTIAGTLATSVTNVSGDQVNWQASRMLSAGSDGPVGFNITYTDITGTAGMPVNMTNDGSSVFLDVTAPTVINLGAPANFINLDPLAVTVQFDSVVTGFDNTMTDIVVTNGNAVAITPSDGLNYTVSVRPFGTGNLTVAVAAGAAQDAAGNPNPESSMVTIVDNLPAGAPRLTAINIVSNNPNNSGYARDGETVTITMTADEPIAAPVVTIAGSPATSVINMSGDQINWMVSRNVLATDTGVVQDMPVAFTIDIADTSGTPGVGQFVDVTDGSSVIFDNLGPTLTISGVPMNFDTLAPLSVTFLFSENVGGFEAVEINVAGGSLSGFAGGADTYTATVTPDATMDLTVSVAAGVAADAAGNTSAAASATAIRNDTTPPTLTAVSISSSNANPAFARTGDVVTLAFTASEGLMTPSVTISGGVAVVTSVGTDGTGWQATRTAEAGDMQTVIEFAINYVDLFGNPAAMPGTATTNMSSVTFDITAPTLSINGAPAATASMDSFVVTFQFDSSVTDFTVGDVAVTNGTAGTLATSTASTYTLPITPVATGDLTIDVAAGAAFDLAGNPSGMATGVTVTVDLTPPELTAVTITSNNNDPTFAKASDVVTINFTASENIETVPPTATIAGEVAAVTGAGTVWEASRTVSAMDAAIVQGGPIAFTIDFEDVLGNAGVQVTSTIGDPTPQVTFDSLAPTLTIGGMPATLTSLDFINIAFSFSEDVTGFDDNDLVIENGTLLAFTPLGAASYTADIEPDGVGDFTVSVASGVAVGIDAAGNGIEGDSASAELVPFWLLAWSDEFDGTVLDGDNWTARTDANCPDPCTSIGEQSYQTANVSVADGMLKIVAMDDGGSVFSSGLVDTRVRREFQHGRVVIRAKLPATTGSEPSLWLGPAPTPPSLDGAYGPWPLSGEIDIVNAPNLDVSPIRKHTLWYGLPEPENTSTTGTTDFTPDGDFHVYAIEWEAGEIRWFVDGVHFVTQTDENWYAYYPQAGGVYDADGVFTDGTGAAPFDQPFYLVMSLAVNSGAGSMYMDELNIDYVRVYECFAGDPVNGTGCGTDGGVLPIDAAMTPFFPAPLPVYTDGAEALDFVDDGGVLQNSALVAETFVTGMGMVTSTLEMPVMDRGNVWNINIVAAGTDTGGVVMKPGNFTSATGYFDLSGGGTAGEVLFDMRVDASTTGGTVLTVGLDSDTGSGNSTLEYTADGVWRQYSVKISDLLTDSIMSGSTLNLANLLNLFVLEATGGTIDLDLDNIRVKVACRDINGCEATARLEKVLYSQNFEAGGVVPIPDGGTIGDNWKFFVNVFENGVFQFNYVSATTPAPNGPQISAIVDDQGGPSQGGQQLSMYSDYNCCGGGFGHQSPNPPGLGLVETSVFQPRTIQPEDAGKLMTFSFDAKKGNLELASTAKAFIRVEDGATLIDIQSVDTTAISTDWERYSVTLTIDGAWEGLALQFGFQTNAGRFEGSGIFYDNVELTRKTSPPAAR